jgi:hypothetical protein
MTAPRLRSLRAHTLRLSGDGTALPHILLDLLTVRIIHGMADSEPDKSLSTADYLAVLKMHVDVSNGEKQAIWARQATMLVGNSLIVNAAWSDAAKLDAGATLFLNGAGLLLCLVWVVMTWNGWGWFHESLAGAKRVPIAPALNPFAGIPDPYRRWRDSIFVCALLVVAIFAGIYVIGLWPAIKRVIELVCSR